MKKTNKKLLLTSALVSVCGCFALVACGDDTVPTPKPKALDTPTNVSVSVNTLSWSEVTGATNGYTVKINSDETTTVDTTSLDLTTVVTLLSEGDNSLQVKANAAGGKTASAYSAAVTYEYHATVTPTPFDRPVITLNGDTITWAAVTGATNGYTVKVNTPTKYFTTIELNLLKNTAVNNLLIANSDNSISVKVKAAGDKLESEYSNTVTYKYEVSSDKAAKDFIAAVNAIGTVSADKADAIGLAKTKYNAIKTNEEALAVEGVSNALATLKQKDAQYFAVLVSGIQAVTENSEVSAFATFETKYAAALAYYGGLLDNTVAAAVGAKGGLDAAKGNYDNLVNGIKDAVDDLADEIDALLAVDYTETEPTVAALDALDEKAEAITALKPYAAAYWAEEYAAKATGIASKKTEILSIAVSSRSSTFIIGSGIGEVKDNVVNVIYEARNVLNNVIKFTGDNIPTISITVNNGEAKTGTFTVNENGKCTYSVNWLRSEESGKFLTVSYSINGGEPITEEYNGSGEEGEKVFTVAATTFDSENGYNAFKDGKVHFTNLSLFFDMYLASDIVINADNTLTVTGCPIVTHIPVTDGVTTEAELRSYLGRNYEELIGQTLDVRFVMYRTEDGTENTKRNTIYDHERVSHDPYTLAITEQDLRLDISRRPDNNTEFTWNLGSNYEGNIAYSWEIAGQNENNGANTDAVAWNTANMLWDEVRINIYDATDFADIENHDFINDEPFAYYAINRKQGVYGDISWQTLNGVLSDAWKELPKADRKMEYKFVFAMQAIPNAKGTQEKYTASTLNYAVKDGAREVKVHNFRTAINTNDLIDTGMYGKNDSFAFTLISGNDEIVGNWLGQFNGLVDGYELTAENAADYLEIVINIYNRTNDDTSLQYTKTVEFKTKSYGFTALMQDWLLDELKGEFMGENAVDELTKNFTIKYSIKLKEKVGEENNALIDYFTSASTEEFTIDRTADGVSSNTYTFKKSELMIPTTAQIFFREQGDAGVIAVAQTYNDNRPNGPKSKGEAFLSGGVKYVVIKFTKTGEQDKYLYLYCADENPTATSEFKLYTELGEDDIPTGNSETCHGVADGWLNVDDLGRLLFGVDGNNQPLGNLKEWAMSTKIVANDKVYVLGYPTNSSGENIEWSSEQTWANRDGTYVATTATDGE